MVAKPGDSKNNWVLTKFCYKERNGFYVGVNCELDFGKMGKTSSFNLSSIDNFNVGEGF